MRSILGRRSTRLLAAVAVAATLLNAGPRAWVASAASSTANSFWSQTGNAGTSPSTNYLGTTDKQPLVVKTNGTEALRVLPGSSGVGGNVGIGTTTPAFKLDVNGSIHGDSLSIAHNGSIGGDLGVTGTLSAGSLSEGSTPLSSKYAFVGGSNATGTWSINTTGNAATATNFTGSLSGDVSGGQTSTVVGALRGTALSSTAPTDGQVLTYSNTDQEWEPKAISSSIDTKVGSSTHSVCCTAFQTQTFTQSCPPGYVVTGGGYYLSATTMHVFSSHPDDSSSPSAAWVVNAEDDFGGDDMNIYADCMKFSP